jgi:hypothetical protein
MHSPYFGAWSLVPKTFSYLNSQLVQKTNNHGAVRAELPKLMGQRWFNDEEHLHMACRFSRSVHATVPQYC